MTQKWDRTSERQHTLRSAFCADGVEVYVFNLGCSDSPRWQVVMRNPTTNKRVRLMHSVTDLQGVVRTFRSVAAAKRRAIEVAYDEHWLRRCGALPAFEEYL